MKVLLDACVLYPTVMREVLLGAAGEGLFTPLWSDRILEEWARAARKIPDGEVQARAEIAVIRARWPDASVRLRQGDMARLWLPDPDDIHVLAAAIAASAEMLVTLNAKDFPRNTLADEGLKRVAPDELMLMLWDRDREPVRAVTRRVHAQAEAMMGSQITMRALMKKARLPRLGKALSL